MAEGASVWLFSYGTLQQEEVQLATFGRLLEGRADSLPGYATSLFEIKDPEVVKTSGKTHHFMARPSGNSADEVPGVVFGSRRPSLPPPTRTKCRITSASPSA